MSEEETLRKVMRDAAAASALSKQANQRMDDLVADLPSIVTSAVEKAIGNLPVPSEEERQFLSLAVQSQAQRVKLRQAIIEKTVPALVWSAITGTFFLLKHLVEEYARNHGWKP